MIVKIGNKFTDSNDELIVLILEPHEKNIIGNLQEATKILLSPEGITYQI